MSLFPLEKIASDRLEDCALTKLGFSPFWGRLSGRMVMGTLTGLGKLGLGATRLAGRGAWGTAKLFGRTAQAAGSFAAHHPGMAFGMGVPLAYSISQLPDEFEKAQNNIYPENPYQY